MSEDNPYSNPSNHGGETSTRPKRHVEVRSLRYGDIPRAACTIYSAFRGNTHMRYNDDADAVPLRGLRETLRIAAVLADGVYLGDKMFCVNGGDAVILIGEPGAKRGPFSRIISPILGWLESEEVVKRKAEFRSKVQESLCAAFGDTIKDMIQIRGLSTAPGMQGRGYGAALMRIAHDLADLQGRGIYVVTSDAYKYYESIGYTTVQTAFVGENNPAWSGGPVGIRFMHRPPRVSSSSSEDAAQMQSQVRKRR